MNNMKRVVALLGCLVCGLHADASAQGEFRRGDVDGDGVAATINDIFAANPFFPPGPCPAAADTNSDGSVNVADQIYLYQYAAGLGPEPESPGPLSCGPDPLTMDCFLDCPIPVDPPVDSSQTLRLTSTATVTGQSATVRVLYSHDEAINGVSFGVRHDPAQLELVSVSWGEQIIPYTAGGPSLYAIGIQPDGFTMIFLAEYLAYGAGLPVGGNQELLVVEYQALTSGVADVTFAEDVGEPVMLVRSSRAFTSGLPEVAIPTTIDGEVSIDLDPLFIRGDANADGLVDVGDAITMFNNGFVVGFPQMPCFSAGDANDDGQFNIADGIYLLSHLFAGGPTMPAPTGACGPDPTPDGTTCFSFDACP